MTDGLPTLTARIGLLPSVASVVQSEVYALAKRFPTFMAFIGLLARVNSLMPDKSRAVAEGFPTLAPFPRLLPCTSVPLFNHI